MTGPDEPRVSSERYRVSYLPRDHPEELAFSLTVEYRGDGRWGVFRGSLCLDPEGQLGPEPAKADRDAEWRATHRYPFAGALALAEKHVAALTDGGMTADDVLGRMDEYASFTCPLCSATSYSPLDIEQSYCQICERFGSP
jgi:hypothetical protein